MLPHDFKIPTPSGNLTPVEYADALGEAYLVYSQRKGLATEGHYKTPAKIAKFMAGLYSYETSDLRVLDPGSGTGILSAAICEAAANFAVVKTVHLDAYEIDPLLSEMTRVVLSFCRTWLKARGVSFTFSVLSGDFVLANCSGFQMELDGQSVPKPVGRNEYDLVMSNPPYFKLSKDDPRSIACSAAVYGQPNIYSLFMTVSAELLGNSGRLICIVPRSFASGQYFRKFRGVFFDLVTPEAIHLFKSRRDVFKRQGVLQETLILMARRRRESDHFEGAKVLISHSQGLDDLSERNRFEIDLCSVLSTRPDGVMSIPIEIKDMELIHAMRRWPNTLSKLGLQVSTGPVVPFRATEFLCEYPEENTVPLLWGQHVHPMKVVWTDDSISKPQWIEDSPRSSSLLVKATNYVLVRRLSMKESERRLVAAPLVSATFQGARIGLENHLNYIRSVSGEMDEEIACGLAALLNSAMLNRYFSISNGNTQVSAAELRSLPFPHEDAIRAIGYAALAKSGSETRLDDLDALIAEYAEQNQD